MAHNDNDEFDKLLLQSAIDSEAPVTWIDPPKPISSRDAIKRARQIVFLKAFAETGNISQVCKAIGINYTTQREWHKDSWYAKHFKDAYQQYQDRIELEVHNRAIVGEQVPIIGKVQTPFGPEDRIIGYKTVKSENLLMFQAKRHIPEYRDKYEPKDEKPIDINSPMTRITVRLDMIAQRQQNALPLQEKVIDVLPERGESERHVTPEPKQLNSGDDDDPGVLVPV